MQPDHEVYEEEDDGPGGVQTDLIRSYLAFAVRAIRSRRLMAFVIFLPLAVLTVVAAAIWPRTYRCESKMMAVRNQVLESSTYAEGPRPLDGASATLSRRENLAAIAKKADLVRSWNENRPPILQFKDRLMSAIQGTPSEADLLEALTRYLESRLSVSVEDGGVLIIGADWSDPQSAARIVEAAQQIFLEGRHAAEISMIEEKISILDGHASKLRGEVESIAEQLQRMRENKLAEAGKALKEFEAPGMIPSAAPAAEAPRRVVPRPAAVEPDEELPRLKEKLEARKRTLADIEADRSRRLTEAQARVQELKYKYTPAHPQVLLAEQNVETLSREPSQVPAIKEEIQALDAEIKQRTAAQRGMAAASSPGFTTTVGSTGKVAANAEPLPPKIMGLLESGVGVDPAVSAQLGGAVGKYGQLRDEIRTALIDLDKAQAAFNHRYRIINPAEAPNKPSKPKIPTIIGGGFAAALLLALLVPILLELRRGIIVERWQVHQIELPILAELELPPGSKE